ncbi:flagellar basal body rod protein FlgC [Candidatus Contubernalis alkaliaceticus]|uniref:flagellar basal body rod protein FlgC n=1 Tax=Candidatus Contubernalis alkaliaceticus TaxID=338645 RepID=UPI001F4C1096|nr:flagellar basal body rod protein FlgC [Candidatus Contubernalis alkalaceticus]
MFHALSVSASGMTAERFRLDLIANNLANINTTRTAEGGPYRRQSAIFSEALTQALNGAPTKSAGVRVVGVARDETPPRLNYDPTHPDADEEGYVAMPNVNVINEMVDMITATRAYEANVTATNAYKSMFLKALEIGRG